MNATGKQYNALTGAELTTTICNEVKRMLVNSGIDSPAVTYPNVRWAWEFRMWQTDDSAQPATQSDERLAEASSDPQAVKDAHGKNLADKTLAWFHGGSKRFKHNPPTPTEVRQEENLPQPEG